MRSHEVDMPMDMPDETPGSLEAGLSGTRTVHSYEQPVRFSRRKEYRGKKSEESRNETEY